MNGKTTDENFRKAYAIVILDAQETKNNAKKPTIALSAQTVAAPVVPVNFVGTGVEDDPYVIEVAPSTWVQLTATPSVEAGTLQTNTAKWTVVDKPNLSRTGNVIQAQAPDTVYDAGTKAPVTKLVYSIVKMGGELVITGIDSGAAAVTGLAVTGDTATGDDAAALAAGNKLSNVSTSKELWAATPVKAIGGTGAIPQTLSTHWMALT